MLVNRNLVLVRFLDDDGNLEDGVPLSELRREKHETTVEEVPILSVQPEAKVNNNAKIDTTTPGSFSRPNAENREGLQSKGIQKTLPLSEEVRNLSKCMESLTKDLEKISKEVVPDVRKNAMYPSINYTCRCKIQYRKREELRLPCVNLLRQPCPSGNDFLSGHLPLKPSYERKKKRGTSNVMCMVAAHLSVQEEAREDLTSAQEKLVQAALMAEYALMNIAASPVG